MSGVILGRDIVTGYQESVTLSNSNLHVAQYVWDTDSLAWVKQTKSTGATGSDVNVTNFPSIYPVTDNGGSLTVDGTVSISGTVPVSIAASVPVTGTFFQAVQPVSWTGQSVSITGTVPVSGTFWQATQPVSWTGQSVSITGTVPVTLTSTTVTNTVSVNTGLTQPLTDTQLRATAVPVSLTSTTITGTVATREGTNPTSAVTSVASSATTVTLKASNASRKGLTIYNNSTQVLYVKLGATASTSSFTVKLQADGYYEVPFDYTGVVDGIWASANGTALVTEIT